MIRHGLLAAAALAAAPCTNASAAPAVPLCAGLTLVTAISQREGDYESIKTIESVDGGVVRLKYSTEHPVEDYAGAPSHLQKLKVMRLIRTADLRSANLYAQQFQTNTPFEIPGTTAIGTSSVILAALKSGANTDLGIFDLPAALPSAPKISADPKVHPNVFDYYETYKLQRAESAPVMLSMTVNGVKTELPAIHATGRSDYYGYRAEFYFLDDEDNPLALKWRLRIGSVTAGPKAGMDRDALQVVKMTYRCSAPAAGVSALERALAEQRRAQVFDIYFSFNSDEIREESEPTLREIGELLRRHGDWKLGIDGHTDGIASDAFNLGLSQRRAAAVKDALVKRYGIDTGRLATAGHGKSQPIDTNETAEGRARNRRVELIRT
jgi:outer membrane protein OmpA-like peptidoglycan-associated protein